MSHHLQNLAEEDFCYLTTTGRISGRPHTIEIWFALHEQTIYMLSGGRDRSDWVRNIQADPRVSVELGEETYEAKAHVIDPDAPEDALARELLVTKYKDSEDDLDQWGRTSLPVVITFAEDGAN